MQQFEGAAPVVVQGIAALWAGYFDLPWIQQGASDEMLAGVIGNVAGGLRGDLARNFSVSAKTEQAARQGQKLADEGLANATALHQAAAELLKQIPAARQQFFKSHLLVQSAIQRFSVQAIANLCNATATLAAGGATPSPAAAAAAAVLVNRSLAAFDLLFQAERDAEGSGEWRGMYWADRHRFTNYQARRREVLALQAALARSLYTPATQIDCCQMEYAYQWSPSHLASYPLFYDDAAVRARDFVLVSCANTTAATAANATAGAQALGQAAGGVCLNSADGGKFWGEATVTLSLVAVAGDPDTAGSKAAIKYALCALCALCHRRPRVWLPLAAAWRNE